jgi:hypothetical protein
MIVRDRFILTFAVAVFVTATLLSLLGVATLEVYYSLYLIEFLLLLELMGPYKRSLTAIMQPLAFAFLLGFVYIVAQRVLEILGGGG